MSILRRGQLGRQDDDAGRREAIRAFWAWWASEGADATAAAIADGEPGRVVDALSRQVSGVHERLAWELGPGGGDSEHVLVVTSEGDPQLRPLSRRWRLAAPPADQTWEYSDVRLPAPDVDGVVLRLGEVDLDAASASADARVDGAALDVVVHHPAYAHLPEQPRDTATLLLLDAVLGESAVETWLGSIASSTAPALDPVPLVALRSVVDDLRRQHTGDDGEPAWAVLSGRSPDGHAILASAQVPLRPATAPHLDTYVPVVVPFADVTDEGLPGPGSLDALRALQDHVSGRLGGSGRVVAHQSHDGVRVLHVYVDGTTPAAEQVRAAVAGWDQGAVEVGVRPDPGWDGVAHLRR